MAFSLYSIYGHPVSGNKSGSKLTVEQYEPEGWMAWLHYKATQMDKKKGILALFRCTMVFFKRALTIVKVVSSP